MDQEWLILKKTVSLCSNCVCKMDRRHLYKANGRATIGNNKENVNKMRSKNRASHQDASRELDPAVNTVELPHLERLKLWCIKRDEKKQMAEQQKTTPFDKNKQRRRNTQTKQMNPVRSLKLPAAPPSGGNENDELPNHAEVPSLLNVTFDKENSFNKTFDADNRSPVSCGTVESEALDVTVTPKSSLSPQQRQKRMMWINNGHILNALRKLEPLVCQNAEAGNYFRYRMDIESKHLMEMIQHWTGFKDRHDNIDALGEIEDVINQSRVIIDRKFQTLSDMCEKCQSKTGQPPVRVSDLEAFWQQTFAEVELCKTKFKKLASLEEMEFVNKAKQTDMKNKETTVEASNTDVTSTVKMLRQTPKRVTRRNVTKADGATPTSKPQPAVTPKSIVTRSRTKANRMPSEEPHSTTEDESSLRLTPINRKVTTSEGTPSLRRSHRKPFSVAEK